MATIPGPNPDKPSPIPGAPAKEPPTRPERPEEPEPPAGPPGEPDWKPEKWTPEKEDEPARKPTPI